MFGQFDWAGKIPQSSDRGLIGTSWVESDLFEQFAWAEKIPRSSRAKRVRGVRTVYERRNVCAIDRCDAGECGHPVVPPIRLLFLVAPEGSYVSKRVRTAR